MSTASTTPLVSVVIPTLNRPVLVCRAVQCALDQTYANVEVVVVVDGPDPATLRQLETLQDKRVRIVPLEVNVGLSGARNAGVLASRGEWIGFLDDDDEWMPEKIEKQIATAARDPRTNLVVCRCEERNSDVSRNVPIEFPRPGEPLSEFVYCRQGLMLPSSFLITRQLMIEVPFTQGLRRNEDTDWLLRAEHAGVLHPQWIEDVLVVYHNEGAADRLSRHADWRGRYDWFLERKSLLTPKSIPYYFGRLCISEAKMSSAPVRNCVFLLKEAAAHGKLSIQSVGYLLFVTLTGRQWRRNVRRNLGLLGK